MAVVRRTNLRDDRQGRDAEQRLNITTAAYGTVQHLGNEASLPTIENIAQVQGLYTERKLAA